MTTETIEGEVREVDPPQALIVAEPHRQGHLVVGVGALASLSDEDFDRNLAMLEKGVERAARIKRAIMVEREDYGLIPGTNKPSLLKPGAEKLALAYGLTGSFAHDIKYGDGELTPPLTVVVDSYLHLGGAEGPIVAQGMGMASSWEKRYRWRKGGRVCPDCGKQGVIFTKGRGGQWWHPSDAKPDGGCGANFPAADARLADQDTADIENPDPYELGNTLLKMAEKRAYVDAVLRATASSGLFTQDMEEDEGDGNPGTGVEQRAVGQHADPPPRAPLVRTTGNDGLIGKVATTQGYDFNLRQAPNGDLVLPFRVKEGNRSGQMVLAEGDALAIPLEARRETIIGQRVTVWGTYTDEESPPKADGFIVRYKVLHLSRIKGDGWELPGQVEAVPEPMGLVDDDLSDLPDGVWIANEASDAGSRR